MSCSVVARTTRHTLIVSLVLATLAAAAPLRITHAAPARVAPRTITIDSTHISFPKSIAAGMIAVHLVAGADSALDAGIARINPGSTMADVGAASASGDMARLSRFVTFLGGVGVPPRGAGTVIIDLRTPGNYGLHITRGDQGAGSDLMFTVTAAGARRVTMPRADVTVDLRGPRFVGLPKILRAGATTFKVTNSSAGVRDMLLFRADAGKTVRDMIAAENVDAQTGKDPAWLHDAASLDILSPHQTVWATVNLIPGSYFALCPLPDSAKKNGQALALEGMLVPLTVS